MKQVYVGIDIGSKVTYMAAINKKGKMIDAANFSTNMASIIDFLGRQQGETFVLLEEGELAGWVYRELTPHADKVVVCDPKLNAWIAKSSNKNDKIDAAKLAELARVGSYSPVYHPEDEKMSAFKIVVQHYQESAKRLSRIKTQIKARLRTQGIITKGSGVYHPGKREEILSLVPNPAIRSVIEQDFRLMDVLSDEKSRAVRRMLAIARGIPVIGELKRMPGVGPINSAIFVAYIQDPSRFNTGSEYLRYCRLGISKRVSNNQPIGREHLDWNGNPSLKDVSRKAFNAAMITKDDNPFKISYRASLKRTGSEKSARLNTQRKIMLVMRAIWRDGTGYSPDKLMDDMGA